MNPTEPTKKKDTIRISKKDLLKLLSENEQQAKQIKDLQGRCNEYLEEVRSLKKDLEEAEAKVLELEENSLENRLKKAMEDRPPVRPHNPMPFHPMGPDIYIDGASKFGR